MEKEVKYKMFYDQLYEELNKHYLLTISNIKEQHKE